MIVLFKDQFNKRTSKTKPGLNIIYMYYNPSICDIKAFSKGTYI